MARRIRLDFTITCTECNGSASVFEKGDRFWTHCLTCGAMYFWKNPLITERISQGRPICLHGAPLTECKTGYTRNCRICRVRMFRPPLLEGAKGILAAGMEPITRVSSGA